MSTDVSSVTKHFPSAQIGFTTTLASTISSGATTVPLNSVAGYNNGEVAVMIIEPTSTTAKQTLTGTIDTSGVQLTNVVWTSGTNQTHNSGVTVVDYESATHFSMISKGIKVQHNQDGTHSATTHTGITNVGAFSQTGAIALAGSWDGWVGANETWTFATSSTITVPTDATTKYDVGDFIKITQSATVKYFIITALTSTVLTVSGLNSATVANSTISANAYSKVANPHGAVKKGPAQTATVATSETTASTSYAFLTTTTDQVTCIIGLSGTAMISLMSYMSNNTSAAECYVSVDVSGSTTTAAADVNAVRFQSINANEENQSGVTFMMTGLAAGSTTFKMKYKVATGGGGAGTGTFLNRRITVIPM